MTVILSDFTTPALAGANRQNLYDFAWELRDHWKQADFYGDEKLHRWWSPVPMGFIFNAAISLQAPKGDEGGLIGETIAYFQSRDRDQFDWWLSSGLETSGWPRLLAANGLRFLEGVPGMAVDLSTLPETIPHPADLKICRVEDAVMMKTWAKTFQVGYGLPPDWETILLDMMLATMQVPGGSYLAFIQGQPVAASSLFPDAGVAGIYNVATLPKWRGKGIGAAMTYYPLLEARRQGYRAGILQSSDMGYKVYQRLGFKEVCRMNCYHWQTP
jgi:GNAT superfamily N-acetyltransferase